ncbi:hypothetical protein LWI29_014528 [Acer saccharum]|uniref:Response regulatory domain-containing protein n=1 Tax=Acer saccharum TaxID=4024 RepID=A0AA39VDH5_ACESA|nr:hypothetical protein LWI29_014528 [Acer saccharum]KAK1555095.1 hypothetical protein Q3G72_021791 [Acer saccharum]
MTTTANGVAASWRRISDTIDGFDLSPSSKSDEVHVLAVDDSFVDRKVIERLLTISSCKVTAVDSGRRALQFLGLDEEESTNGFDGLKVDLIITDYCMPGMTGYELLKKIKESSTFREIPVVIMSSENVMARIDRCLEEGAEDFIVKPVKLSDVKRIKDCMTREFKLGNEERGVNKRKLRESETCACDLSSSPPSVISSLPSSAPSSPSQSPPPSLLSASPSPSPSVLSSSAPCSPSSSLDSPTRRLKMTLSD